jgi:hypothetical protein
MKLTTQSNSLYEINQKTKQIRRLVGLNNPTPRMGADGNWKDYQSISEIIIGQSLIIVWETLLEDGRSTYRTTMTSPIKSIQYLDDANEYLKD